MALRKSYLDTLRPWLESGGPNEDGEWGMYCPYHRDTKRSASVNTNGTGVYYCQACDVGGTVKSLVADIKAGNIKNNRMKDEDDDEDENGNRRGGERISEAMVAGWASALLANKRALAKFTKARGLDRTTLKDYDIGWDSSGNGCYTIPVRGEDGSLLNVRRYTLEPVGDRRKIWSVAGHGTPVLYPIECAPTWGESVVVCEGELDALATIQAGFDAVTRTGAAKVWKAQWNHHFKDKVVYICHDMDDTGQQANQMVAAALAPYARAVYIVRLPYPVTEKHGKDLTDYWNDGHTYDDFEQLLAEAEPYGLVEEVDVEDLGVEDIAVLDSFDPERVGKHLRMRVTITGKKSPNYIVPRDVQYKCKKNAAAKCNFCPMNEDGYDGETSMTIDAQDPVLLQFMGATNNQVSELLRDVLGAMKCGPKLESKIVRHHSLEELFVRTAIDRETSTEVQRRGFTNRKIIAVSDYETLANNTVEMVGAILPNPRSQLNEFLAWEVEATKTNVDEFLVTPESIKHLKKFQAGKLRPIKKLQIIARDLATNVTRIHGRTEMHCLMDLVFHSVLAFPFDDQLVHKGWLDVIIMGDTRTGKTEASERLIQHYGAGQKVQGESASFAGAVGGLQQVGGRDWTVTWGAIPLNDRRLVVLDEVSGLKTAEISQMSSIRSEGIAQITKIQQETTLARTRLLWLGNPRDGGRMSDFTYGVQSIPPLIGSNEDVARFDMAMTLVETDVPQEEINRALESGEHVPHKYTSEACRTLLNWVWSREPEDIVWDAKVEKLVFEAALELGARYIPNPPLIQAASVRFKIARLAVALAARLCSTDETFTKVVVKQEHVEDAVEFIDQIYRSPGFGYGDLSDEANRDKVRAQEEVDSTHAYLVAKPGLAKFLRSISGHFRRVDLEDMLNMDRYEANATVNTLYKYRMIRREGANIKINPELHKLLREVVDE